MTEIQRTAWPGYMCMQCGMKTKRRMVLEGHLQQKPTCGLRAAVQACCCGKSDRWEEWLFRLLVFIVKGAARYALCDLQRVSTLKFSLNHKCRRYLASNTRSCFQMISSPPLFRTQWMHQMYCTMILTDRTAATNSCWQRHCSR